VVPLIKCNPPLMEWMQKSGSFQTTLPIQKKKDRVLFRLHSLKVAIGSCSLCIILVHH
jgi:hypothetical protein